MRRFSFAALLVTGIAITACGGPASQMSQELPARDKVWEDAMNAGDLDALTALYTEDARLMPPNSELVQGQGAVREAFGEMIASGAKTELETIEAVVASDIGYQVGTYSSVTPDGTVVDRGKFIEVWRKVNDQWKISNDIWNSDMSASASGTTWVITHEVEDGAQWLAAWQGPASRHELFAQHGAPNVRVFQSVDNPNLTGLVVDIEDMDAVQALMRSDEGAAAMAEDRVKSSTMRVFNEVK